MTLVFLSAFRLLSLPFLAARFGEGEVLLARLECFLFKPGAKVLALTVGGVVLVGSDVPSVVVLGSPFPIFSLPSSSTKSLCCTGTSLVFATAYDVPFRCGWAPSCRWRVTGRENARRRDRTTVEMANKNKEAAITVTATTGTHVVHEKLLFGLSSPDFARRRLLRRGIKSELLAALQTQQWPLLVVELEVESVQLPSFMRECCRRNENDAVL